MSLNNTSGNDNFALVPRPSSAVGKAEPGAKRILSGMVADTLALVNREQLKPAEARFRIGDYKWCEPDYRQILMWAKALNLTPETVLERLFTEPRCGGPVSGLVWDHERTTQCVNGRIIRLGWDIGLLPLECFEWVTGLVIESITFSVPMEIYESQRTEQSLSLPLPELRSLNCEFLALTKLDLSAVPMLAELYCYSNQLIELDLSAVPLLTDLRCADNQLTELDLSAVPLLTKLYCYSNQLIELDLSAVPLLTELSCGPNQLTKLDLSTVPLLTQLSCDSNQLTELDLSAVPQLTDLRCAYNQLTELDLSAVPLLIELWCNSNQLIELDLSAVPLLTDLVCGCDQLTELDIRPLEHLKLLAYGPFFKPMYCRQREKAERGVSEVILYCMSAFTLRRMGFENGSYDAEKIRLIQRPDQNF